MKLTFPSVSGTHQFPNSFPCREVSSPTNEKVSRCAQNIFKENKSLLAKGVALAALHVCIVPILAVQDDPVSFVGNVGNLMVGIASVIFISFSFRMAKESRIRTVCEDVNSRRNSDIQELLLDRSERMSISREQSESLFFHRQVTRLLSGIVEYQKVRETYNIFDRMTTKLEERVAEVEEMEKYLKTFFDDFSRKNILEREDCSVVEYSKNFYSVSMKDIASEKLVKAIDHAVGRLSNRNFVRVLIYFVKRDYVGKHFHCDEGCDPLYPLIKTSMGRHIFFRYYPDLGKNTHLLSFQIKKMVQFDRFMRSFLLHTPLSAIIKTQELFSEDFLFSHEENSVCQRFLEYRNNLIKEMGHKENPFFSEEIREGFEDVLNAFHSSFLEGFSQKTEDIENQKS